MIEGEERYAPLVQQGLAHVTAVEPDPAQHERLRAERHGSYRLLPHYLGDGEPATMHVTHYPGCSSFYRPNRRLLDMFAGFDTRTASVFEITGTRRVDTKRLDDLPDCPAPDYLKIDVQGAELTILRNGTNTLASVLVIEAEVEFLPIYENQPLFGDLDSFLREQGFVLHKFVDMAGRYFKPLGARDNPLAALSQVLWADAVFIRDFTALDRLAEMQLLKEALVLHNVYLSYDLVYLLLREYDRRQGKEFATRYARALSSSPGLSRFFLNVKERM